jgi:osmotically inducible protein OsmC
MEGAAYAVATATGGRRGRIRSSDGALAVDLALPTELGSQEARPPIRNNCSPPATSRALTTPCGVVARERRTVIGQSAMTANVAIGRNDAWYYESEMELHVQLPVLERASSSIPTPDVI